MENQHTPGPWIWEINEATKSIKLVSRSSNASYVMDFVRFGLQSAQPRFFKDWLMVKATDFGKVVKGREHHADWYKQLDHPDARLIAAAPDLLEALMFAVKDAERGRTCMAEANKEMGFDEPKKLDWIVKAELAIAKATQP